MSVSLCPTFGVGYQGFTTGGLPLNAGLIYTYGAGGTTPEATYTTSAGNVQCANPIVLGADGRPSTEIWLTDGTAYRFDVKDSLGNLIKTYDNITGGSVSLGVLAASSGSSLLGFIQAGSGAVARTAQTKMRVSVSLEDFGGVADGTYNNFAAGTDNSAALALAIAALPASQLGGEIILEGRGVYNFLTAPTLRANMTFRSNAQTPWERAPILQYGGTGTFLDCAYNDIYLAGFQVFGQSGVAAATGIKIRANRIRFDNIVIAQFDGVGSFGMDIAGTGTGSLGAYYIWGRNLWVNACENGLRIGDTTTYGNTNSIMINGLLSSGNSKNGVIMTGAHGVNLTGVDITGNVSGGTGANVQIVKAQDVHISGWIELATAETATMKNIILPDAVSGNSANIFIEAYTDRAAPSQFTTEKTRTYFVQNPNQFAASEPAGFTALRVNSLYTFDTANNKIAPVLENASGAFTTGSVSSDTNAAWPANIMKNQRTQSNNPAGGANLLDLTAFLKGRQTSVEGMLEVHSDEDNCAALFYLKNNTTVEYLDPAGKFSATASTASSTNIYWSTDHYEVENLSSGTRNYTFHMRTIT